MTCVQPASSNPSGNEDGTADFDTAIIVVISLLTILKVKSLILVILQLEHGTNLFERTRVSDQATFWQVTCEIAKLVQKEKQFALLILCREADKEYAALQQSQVQFSFNPLKGLYEDGATEFMCHYRSVPQNLVPVNLRNFILNVSLGNLQVGQQTAWKELCCRTCFYGTNCSKQGGSGGCVSFWDLGGLLIRGSRMREVSTSSASSSVQLPQHAVCLVR